MYSNTAFADQHV